MSLRKISFLPLLALFLVLFNSAASLVQAQEFVISGNGGGSDNQINVQATTTTEVTQTNEAQVTNNVEANANTGSNEASLNTSGEANITTGDISTQTDVQTAANFSSVDIPCCEAQPSNFTISGNGAGSVNSVDFSQINNQTITVSNSAGILNSINIEANSGRNTANYNGGSVSIDTGNIIVKNKIKNGPVNVYNVSAGIASGGVSAIISENASDSTNIISANVVNNKQANINSVAKIGNIVFVNANTGDNEANGNMGDVSIKTGDILIDSTIENGPINVGGVDFDCCEIDPGTTPTPSPSPTPYDPGDPGGSSGGGGGSSAGAGSSSGPSVLGLSNTSGGSETSLIFLAGLAMILGGAYLVSKQYGKGKKEIFAFS